MIDYTNASDNFAESNHVQDLTNKANYIIVGRVESVHSLWENSTIVTYVNVTVLDNEKGTLLLNSWITIKHIGGMVGTIGLSYSEQPFFENGETTKLFLQKESNDIFTVVDGSSGKIPVEKTSPLRSLGYAVSDPPVRWSYSELPVHYRINPTSPNGVNSPDWIAEVQSSFQTWENDLGSFMDYTYDGTTLSTGPDPNTGTPFDGINGVYAKSGFNNSNVLGRAYYWYDFSTAPEYYRIFEIDIIFNNDYQWSASGETGKYDVQNVGTHEVGHTLNLLDQTDPAYSEETMFQLTTTGETKKRTLHSGDISGVRFLYPISQSLSNISSLIINAEQDTACFIYPDYEGSKPPGVFHAALSDWTAIGFIIGMCSNSQNETTDTDPNVINTGNGRITLTNGNFVLFGGPLVNSAGYYYENNRFAPVYWGLDGSTYYWYLANGTRLDSTGMPFSQIAAGNQDMFLIEAFTDSSDNVIYYMYGYGWKGTFAAGKFFKFVIAPDIASYTGSFYVFRWTDTDSDSFVDLDEIDTTPVVQG
ncbi:matrixin family metalloprotease [Thermoproteota archaeon]